MARCVLPSVRFVILVVLALAMGRVPTATVSHHGALAQTGASDGPYHSPLPVLGHIGGLLGPFDTSGGHLFVAIGQQLAVFDVSAPGQYRELGRSGLLPAPARQVVAEDSGVYVVTQGVPGIGQPSSLVTIDVQDPTAPRIADVVDSFERYNPLDIAVADGKLYAACDTNGLRVFDVGGPGPPTEIGRFDDGTAIESVETSTSIAVVASRGYDFEDGTYRSWIKMIDITQPEEPQRTGQLEFSDHVALVSLSGSVAIVAGARSSCGSGLCVVDVSDPGSPIIVSDIEDDFDTRINGLTHDGLFWVGGRYDDDDWDYHLAGFDLADPTKPRSLGSVSGLDAFTNLAADSGRVLHGNEWAVRGLDVADPEQPQRHGTTPNHIGYERVVTDGERLFASGTQGPWIGRSYETIEYEASDPAQPQLVRRVESAGTVMDVVIDGEAFAVETLPEGTCQWRGLDGNESEGIRFPGACTDLTLADGLHYVATESDVYVVDRRRPGPPLPQGALGVHHTPHVVAASDGVAWVVTLDVDPWTMLVSARTLEVYDVADLDAPRHLGSVALGLGLPLDSHPAGGVLADGGVAWVTDAGRLRVFGVAVDDSVVEHQGADAQRDTDALARDGNRLFVVGREFETHHTLVVYDVTDTRSPRPLAAIDLSKFSLGASGIAAASDRLYAASWGTGIAVFDASAVSALPEPTPRATRTPTTEPALEPPPTLVPQLRIHLPICLRAGA